MSLYLCLYFVIDWFGEVKSTEVPLKEWGTRSGLWKYQQKFYYSHS